MVELTKGAVFFFGLVLLLSRQRPGGLTARLGTHVWEMSAFWMTPRHLWTNAQHNMASCGCSFHSLSRGMCGLRRIPNSRS